MVEGIQSPAQATYWLIQGRVLFWIILVLGTACFAYIVAKRLAPLRRGERDGRFDRPWVRLGRVLQFWLGQWRHPRYKTAGTIHILIFTGFIVLVIRAFSLLILGVSGDFVAPGLAGWPGHIYDILKDYAATMVLVAVVIAAIRRLIFKPARYRAPAKYGKGRSADAIFLLALIGILMAADGLFEASSAAGHAQLGQPVEFLATLSLPWMLKNALMGTPVPALQNLHLGGYLTHELTFFFLLCYRPFGIQFHVETSLFAVYFAKLDREILKDRKSVV